MELTRTVDFSNSSSTRFIEAFLGVILNHWKITRALPTEDSLKQVFVPPSSCPVPRRSSLSISALLQRRYYDVQNRMHKRLIRLKIVETSLSFDRG
jgi:hypothetical protein